MKKSTVILILYFICNFSFGQDKATAEKLVDEGVAYHDKGDYEGAISRYDKALELDKRQFTRIVRKSV